MRLAGPGWRELGAKGDEHHQLELRRLLDQQDQKLERRGVNPLCVLEDE